MMTINGISVHQPQTNTDHLFGMVDYLNSMVSPDGAMRSSYTTSEYWKDCGLGFLTLTIMSGRLHPNYRVKVKQGLKWLASHQTETGVWYEGYTGVNYDPLVVGNPGDVTRCTDWSQCIPIVCLAIYSSMFGDEEFVCSIADSFLFGLDTFLQDNYNSTLGLYDRAQVGRATITGEATINYPTNWLLSGHYSAQGQGVVFMALNAAYALTGSQKYKIQAQQLFEAFGEKMYSPTLGFYQRTLDDTTTLDLQTLGLTLWMFGSNLPFTQECVTRAATWAGTGGGVAIPPSSTTFTQNSVWLALALKTTGSYETLRTSLFPTIAKAQIELYPNSLYGDGGIQDTPGVPTLPVNVTAGAALVFSEEPSSILWWP